MGGGINSRFLPRSLISGKCARTRRCLSKLLLEALQQDAAPAPCRAAASVLGKRRERQLGKEHCRRGEERAAGSAAGQKRGGEAEAGTWSSVPGARGRLWRGGDSGVRSGLRAVPHRLCSPPLVFPCGREIRGHVLLPYFSSLFFPFLKRRIKEMKRGTGK